MLTDCLLPLLRLLGGITLGILIANLLEALNWTRCLAFFARPFARMAHLGDVAAASFTQAFISPNAANALLSENYHAGKISRKELTLANLFNSFPAYFVHTPTLFFLFFPILGKSAFLYVGLSLLAAFLRTALTLLVARFLLTEKNCSPLPLDSKGRICVKDALHKALIRLKKRLPRLLLFTVPLYLLMYALQVSGQFRAISEWLTEHAFWTDFLSPQQSGIIALHMLAELGSALGACQALLATNGISQNEVIVALLLGNILSTPIRAIRHQLPSYAGYFRPGLGLRLLLMNQTLRAFSMLFVTVLFLFFTHAH